MRRIEWPQNREPAVAVPDRNHSNSIRVANQMLDHARAGREALEQGHLSEAKYHRDCCSVLIWRLAVDGLTANGQLRFDGAKYETRIPGRLSSKAARELRESRPFANRTQGTLQKHLVCDHVVSRNCVAEALISPECLDLSNVLLAYDFIFAHAEIAIITPEENAKLDARGWKSEMPDIWWEASLHEKFTHVLARYADAKIEITRWHPSLSAPASLSSADELLRELGLVP